MRASEIGIRSCPLVRTDAVNSSQVFALVFKFIEPIITSNTTIYLPYAMTLNQHSITPLYNP